MKEFSIQSNFSKNNELRNLLGGIDVIVWKIHLTHDEFKIFGGIGFFTGYDNDNINVNKTALKEYIDISVVPEDRQRVIDEYEDFLNSDSVYFNIQCRIKSKIGIIKWININGNRVKSNEILVGTVTDYTDKKYLEDRLNFMTFHDKLTNLPNKAFFVNELNKIINKPNNDFSKSAVMLINIDNFSSFNDSFGNSYGDVLLKLIAQLIKICVEEYGITVRLDGDEFAILVPEIKNKDYLSEVSKTILDNFQNPLEVLDIETYITVSMGICIFEKGMFSKDQILRNANIAMHNAKLKGKNSYIFYTEKLVNIANREKLIESELQKALENNELEIYYQPQVNFDCNKIRGMEALLRWKSPKLGTVNPSEFIPIAEESGLINKIGEMVLTKACIQAKDWKDKGYSFDTISVNVSPKQIDNKNFLKAINKALKESGLEPTSLEIEITEGTLIRSINEKSKQLEKLINRGVKVSIDDFGKGYSSLNYLITIPINTLKIDKSFVDKICNNNKSLSIVECIVELSKKLNYKVIAEGVEKLEQKDILGKIGCNYYQGYYYRKPLPSYKMEAIFKDEETNYA